MRNKYIYERKDAPDQTLDRVLENIWSKFDFKEDLERSAFHKITQIHDYWIDSKAAESGKENIKILDAGCGMGRLLRYYSNKGFHIYGFEILRPIASKVKENFPSLNILNADITRVPFQNGIFDLYLSVGVLVWVPVEDNIRVFAEANRVLKPGGILILDTHHFRPINVLKDWIQYLHKIIINKNQYIRKPMGIDYHFRDIKRLCKEANFKIIQLSAGRTGYFLYRIQKIPLMRKLFLLPTGNTLCPYTYKWKLEKIFSILLQIFRAYGGSVIVVAQKTKENGTIIK